MVLFIQLRIREYSYWLIMCILIGQPPYPQ